MIVDYSDWRPSASQLAGINGVIRYLSHDVKKATAAAELAELHSKRIGTALVFEDTASRATAGYSAGLADGKFSLAQALSLAVPEGRPVYAAVDFDIPDYAPTSSDPFLKLGPTGAYLKGFAAGLAGRYALGAYGGFWLVSRALDAKLVHWAWQTVAWSGDKIDHRIALYQTGVQIFSGNADLDFAGWRDWGQFRRSTVELVGAVA